MLDIEKLFDIRFSELDQIGAGVIEGGKLGIYPGRRTFDRLICAGLPIWGDAVSLSRDFSTRIVGCLETFLYWLLVVSVSILDSQLHPSRQQHVHREYTGMKAITHASCILLIEGTSSK